MEKSVIKLIFKEKSLLREAELVLLILKKVRSVFESTCAAPVRQQAEPFLQLLGLLVQLLL